MRRACIPFSVIYFLLLCTVSCRTVYQPQAVQYADYRLNNDSRKDSNVLVFLKPYTDSVNTSMNDVVAVAAEALEKKQPESALGNLLVDALLSMAREKYSIEVDAAFLNYGGIRLPSLAAGNITRGKVFEMSPFDNLIVILKLNGKVLQQFLDHISALGGWPGAGVSWQIRNDKAIHVLINGKPISESATYTIATNDYVANGGDDCAMLRPILQLNKGYIFRDAVMEYLKRLNREGKTISAKIENRVTNAQ